MFCIHPFPFHFFVILMYRRFFVCGSLCSKHACKCSLCNFLFCLIKRERWKWLLYTWIFIYLFLSSHSIYLQKCRSLKAADLWTMGLGFFRWAKEINYFSLEMTIAIAIVGFPTKVDVSMLICSRGNGFKDLC